MLEAIDIFRSPVGVRINENLNYKTKCGGMISILVILFMIFISMGSILAFYFEDDEYRETVTVHTLNSRNEQHYEISDTEAIIAF